MAPFKSLKTYSRKPKVIPLRKPNSVDVFDALLAGNLSKRIQNTHKCVQKRGLSIKELPSIDENHKLLDDSVNLNFEKNSTFDRLLKQQPISFKPNIIDESVGGTFVSPTCSIVSPNGGHNFLFQEKLDFSHFNECEKGVISPYNLPASSTPASSLKIPCVLQDNISPILAVEENETALLESYKKIYDWSFVAPRFENVSKPIHKRKYVAKRKAVGGDVDCQLRRSKRLVVDGSDFYGWSTDMIRESVGEYTYFRSIVDIYERSVVDRSTRFLTKKEKSYWMVKVFSGKKKKRKLTKNNSTLSTSSNNSSVTSHHTPIGRTSVRPLKIRFDRGPVLNVSTKTDISYSSIVIEDSDSENERNEQNKIRRMLGPEIMSFHNYTKPAEESSAILLHSDKLFDELVIDLTGEQSESSSTTDKDVQVISDTEEPEQELDVHEVPEPSNITEIDDRFVPSLPVFISKQKSLRTGKLFRRSILDFKRRKVDESLMIACINNCSGLCTCCQFNTKDRCKSFFGRDRRLSVRVLPEKQYKPSTKTSKASILREYAEEAVIEETTGSKEDIAEEPNGVINLTVPVKTVNACDIILARCGQTEPLLFSQCYTPAILKDCRKIGEGVYGEVFEYVSVGSFKTVMKIIPIEGDLTVNGEHQKKYEEILSEIVICMELSYLKYGIQNATSGFSEVYRIRCVKGPYPSRLLQLWDTWNEENNSENDNPSMFQEDQLYMILELAHGGCDMEEYVFKSSKQTLSLFKQMAFTLAVGEAALSFEHRDLHWGNVLINPVDLDKNLTYVLNGTEYLVPALGVEGSIIDFTLSRITYDGICIYNDLSLDPELFIAKGDYQFDIYRLMRESNENNWSEFNPYTNILWLHYTIDKMIKQVRYHSYKTKRHLSGIRELRQLKDSLLQYRSVRQFVEEVFCN